MEDSELFNLTVAELRSLCSDRGLNAAKLRKKEIVELLIDNGVSGIPAEFLARASPRTKGLTPRKSIAKFRRDILTPQKSEPNESNSDTPTTRSSRYSRFLQLATLRELEQQKLSSNKENQKIGSESLNVNNETPGESSEESTKYHEGDEFADASEQHIVVETEKEEAPSEEGSKESEDAASSSSFITAVSSANSTFDVDKGEGDDPSEFVTPQKGRKMWSTSLDNDFSFAEDPNPSTSPSAASEGSSVSAESPTLIKEQIECGLDAPALEKTPELPKLLRQETFTVKTPALKSTKGVAKASKVGFKASKTPNFKQIHARNQAKFENIAEYSARKRDRMKQLLSVTREMRSAGAASLNSAAAPKTPLRGARALSRIETPVSEKKILSNKVRSNRRFELLMKARGLPMDGEVLEFN